MSLARTSLVILLLLGVALAGHAGDQERLMPYVLAGFESGSIDEVTTEVRSKLSDAGFQVLGQYSPYEGATIVAFTSPGILDLCAQSENGGFAAALRVSMTQADDRVQVAYNCPRYLANAYRLNDDMSDIDHELAMVLGNDRAFGSEKGIEIDDLRDYNYVPGGFIPMPMPEFDDVDVLAEFDSFQAANEAVEAGLSATSGAVAVYKVAIPGTEQVLYGVGISEGDGSDTTVMGNCDQQELKATAHLPYEMLINGNRVIALRGKFRIAQSFPDLSMGTFMKIRKAPSAIEDALRTIVTVP